MGEPLAGQRQGFLHEERVQQHAVAASKAYLFDCRVSAGRVKALGIERSLNLNIPKPCCHDDVFHFSQQSPTNPIARPVGIHMNSFYLPPPQVHLPESDQASLIPGYKGRAKAPPLGELGAIRIVIQPRLDLLSRIAAPRQLRDRALDKLQTLAELLNPRTLNKH